MSATACQQFSRSSAYTLYNLSVGIVVGLARTILAIVCLARHHIYSKRYDTAYANYQQGLHEQQVRKRKQRTEENFEARQQTAQAPFLKKLTKKASELKTRGKNKVEEKLDSAVFEVKVGEACFNHVQIKNHAEELFDWELKQLGRGVLELLWVGAPYYTCADYMSNWQVTYYGSILDLLAEESRYEELVDAALEKFSRSAQPEFPGS